MGQAEEPGNQRSPWKSRRQAGSLPTNVNVWMGNKGLKGPLAAPIRSYFTHASNKCAELTFRSTHSEGHRKMRRGGKGCQSHMVCGGRRNSSQSENREGEEPRGRATLFKDTKPQQSSPKLGCGIIIQIKSPKMDVVVYACRSSA